GPARPRPAGYGRYRGHRRGAHRGVGGAGGGAGGRPRAPSREGGGRPGGWRCDVVCKVVVREAETLGWGASTRNGGMCHPGFKWGITSLRKRHGAALGEQLYQDSIEAFELVAAQCGPDGPIDADFVRSGHLELAFTPSHAAHQQATADALAHADMP